MPTHPQHAHLAWHVPIWAVIPTAAALLLGCLPTQRVNEPTDDTSTHTGPTRDSASPDTAAWTPCETLGATEPIAWTPVAMGGADVYETGIGCGEAEVAVHQDDASIRSWLVGFLPTYYSYDTSSDSGSAGSFDPTAWWVRVDSSSVDWANQTALIALNTCGHLGPELSIVDVRQVPGSHELCVEVQLWEPDRSTEDSPRSLWAIAGLPRGDYEISNVVFNTVWENSTE